ncbi:carbohydrate-binding domain-containing protein [Candidatus Saccharibacteria bacterium]|nr:carbohydrate-binding domain-containing protein [Candidatus Saccharibacteria bacterium]
MARDYRWLIIVLIIIVAIIATSVANSQYNPDTTTRLETALDIDNGDLKVDWDKYPTTDIELTNSIELTNPGTYHLTGTLMDGVVSVKLADDAPIRLVLDNVTIYNSDGPAIICQEGDDLVIELVGENTLADSATYNNYDTDVTGTIYSKADLTFIGDGLLNIGANYADGIVGKDDLTFRGGTYHIAAADDAIRGKDSVRVANGSFVIDAVVDAIKSTNDTDSGKGFILIENGNFNLTAGAKGLQAIRSILIHDGNFVITATDDAVHSDNYIGITGGTLNISAGDDAVHADRELVIDGGYINIAKSYEGLEAQKITITDGDIRVMASDDGINAGGGADQSAANQPNRKDPFAADENCILSIDGGNLYVNASGDGIDSNGWLYINGGTTIVDGPTNDGNGALDAGLGIIVNGGELIALGSSGMAEAPNQTSAINNVSVYLSQTYPADTSVEIRDQNENVVISHTSAKAFSHLAFSSPAFRFGDVYTLYLNDEKYSDLTISGIVTTIGNTNRGMNPRR